MHQNQPDRLLLLGISCQVTVTVSPIPRFQRTYGVVKPLTILEKNLVQRPILVAYGPLHRLHSSKFSHGCIGLIGC